MKNDGVGREHERQRDDLRDSALGPFCTVFVLFRLILNTRRLVSSTG